MVVSEGELHVEPLTATIHDILRQPDEARRMAMAALALGKPDAARELAAMVETLAGGQSPQPGKDPV